MTIERIHRLMMASVIGLGTGLIYYGIAEGIYILFFVIGMLVIYGVTNSCPSIWLLKLTGIKTECQKKDFRNDC